MRLWFLWLERITLVLDNETQSSSKLCSVFTGVTCYQCIQTVLCRDIGICVGVGCHCDILHNHMGKFLVIIGLCILRGLAHWCSAISQLVVNHILIETRVMVSYLVLSVIFEYWRSGYTLIVKRRFIYIIYVRSYVPVTIQCLYHGFKCDVSLESIQYVKNKVIRMSPAFIAVLLFDELFISLRPFVTHVSN